jgi:hypothetical protein
MSAVPVCSVVCPNCGAAAGAWCVRHGQTQPGPLLACAARVRAVGAVGGVFWRSCPAGEIAGSRHTFPAGSGVVVAWDVFGDSESRREVCTECAAGSWL